MSNKPKMTKDTIPENFTLSLALVDALPVLFFGGSMILIGLLFGSPLFLIGAALCFWAGAAKVLWKIIVVTKKKNVWWMFLQMRIVMPLGFVLMILAVILNRSAIDLSNVFAAIVSLPSVIFFTIGVIGMVLMAVFVPVSFMKGITGQMFRQFALCIASSIGLSTLVALTLSPALCSMILKTGQEEADFEFIRKFDDWFNSCEAI